MKKRNTKKVIRLTESDLQKIVKRVLTEQAPDTRGQQHREEIEEFFNNPFPDTDKGRRAKQKLIDGLEDDAYSRKGRFDTGIGKGTKGAVKIKLNGREMVVMDFIREIEDDFEDGICHKMIKYGYNNKPIGGTWIEIETMDEECEQEEEIEVEVDPVGDIPATKKESCSKEWRDNVLKLGHKLYPPYFDWNKVVPKMGYSKESVCNCFKKTNDRRMVRFCRGNQIRQ